MLPLLLLVAICHGASAGCAVGKFAQSGACAACATGRTTACAPSKCYAPALQAKGAYECGSNAVERGEDNEAACKAGCASEPACPGVSWYQSDPAFFGFGVEKRCRQCADGKSIGAAVDTSKFVNKDSPGSASLHTKEEQPVTTCSRCNTGFYAKSGACAACVANATCPLSVASFVCNADTYMKGDACQQCLADAVAAVGSTSTSDCKCVDGKYRSGDACVGCPTGATTGLGVGATSVKSCKVCLLNYYPGGAAGDVCKLCPTGSQSTVQVKVVNQQDPSDGWNTVQVRVGTTSLSDCKCKADTYMKDSACQQCLADAVAAVGSTSTSACKCKVGMYMDDKGACVACPAGSTHVAGVPGSVSVFDCFSSCKAGEYLSGGKCVACFANSTSAAGAVNASDCACDASTFGSGGACSACTEGKSARPAWTESAGPDGVDSIRFSPWQLFDWETMQGGCVDEQRQTYPASTFGPGAASKCQVGGSSSVRACCCCCCCCSLRLVLLVLVVSCLLSSVLLTTTTTCTFTVSKTCRSHSGDTMCSTVRSSGATSCAYDDYSETTECNW